MPFVDDTPVNGPLGLPDWFNASPKPEDAQGSVIGSALRLESPIVSPFYQTNFDRYKNFDPNYMPSTDIMGTKYEPYIDRFSAARDAEDVRMMKVQLDREMADRQTVAAAGWMGVVASMGASLLSPTTLLPGGAIVKGAKGIKIAETGLSVALSAGVATAIDEAVLQSTQQTRSGVETGFAIGGSMILGGLLGTGAGALSSKAFNRTSAIAAKLPGEVRQFDDALRSVGAADATVDFTVRREKVFQTIQAIPILRAFVRTDPILRNILSSNAKAREAGSALFENPLQYAVNETGQSVTAHLPDGVSAETAIKTRRNVEFAQFIGFTNKSYNEYARDGAVGFQRFTAPVTAKYQHLVGLEKKMNKQQFFEEVGKSARRGDDHPIAQVKQAAEQLRTQIFDKIKQEAIDLGIFDENLQLKYAESYYPRAYNQEKIQAHLGDGTPDDFKVVLEREFRNKKQAAENRLAFDSTVSQLEGRKYQLKEGQRTRLSALGKAIRKTTGKKGRAEAAIKREGAVGRVTGALKEGFKARAKGLTGKLLTGEELSTFKAMLKDARGLKRLEPVSLLQRIRSLGGIKDPRSNGVFDGVKGWTKNMPATELEQMLGSTANTIRRKGGLEADHMRANLAEMGYLPEGATINDMFDAISKEAAGEKVYAVTNDAAEIARYDAAKEFSAALDEMGIDTSKPIDEIVGQIQGKASNQAATKAKAGEAARSAGKAGQKVDASSSKLMKAIDRLEEAKARLKELDDVVGPKVRKEINAAQEELAKLLPELKKAKEAQSADEFYASLDDNGIAEAVDSTIESILGLKPGENSFHASFANPKHARVLDIQDEIIEPWLDSNAEAGISQYFNSMIPDMELMKRFGTVDISKSSVAGDIIREGTRKQEAMAASKAGKGKVSKVVDWLKTQNGPLEEAKARVRELTAMGDRLRGIYGAPADPKSTWVRGFRMARTVSYTGYLGQMTLSAMPDVGTVVGRNGLEAAFGSITALTDPKRFKMALKDARELGAAAEWWLNSRATSIGEVLDPYGVNTPLERGLAVAGQKFGYVTGMIPWNAGLKNIGGALISSKMAKAAEAVARGKATKHQLIALSENGIDKPMARRIADQVEQFGDKNGSLWLAHGGKWTDEQAYKAFEHMLNREVDLMVITPGQDKPLIFSSETGKFFSQFKTFIASAHNRVLLSGIQRADADVIAMVTTGIILGKLVSNIKADTNGYPRKEGGAAWLDAIDRAGFSGWLMDAHAMANGLSGGNLSPYGQVSRYQSRSVVQGLLGPTVDMAVNAGEAVSAVSRGDATYRDVRKLMRPIPGNNLPLPHIINIYDQIEKGLIDLTGAKPRR